MTSSALRRLLPLLFGLLVMLSAGDAVAQTTASLRGVVIDDTDQPLPGVNVVAIHQPTGTQYGTATKPDGSYAILNMRVGGPYTVRASFVGYQTIEQTGVTLALNEQETIDFTLRPKTEELEGIEVIASRDQVINSRRTGASLNVTQEQIDALPTISRSLTDFARLIPQYSGGGSFGGNNDRYNSIQIDGATLDDVFGLGEAVPGSQAGTQPISLDAIEEFNIEIAPFDVRNSGFTGGQINAITKSGSNQYEGSVRYLGRTERFTGDLNGEGAGEFGEQYFVGTFGGPIIKDELFFFTNAEVVTQTNPLDATVGGSGINTFQLEGVDEQDGGDVLERYGYDSTSEVFQDIREIAQSVYGYDPGSTSPISQDQTSYKFLGKLDWNLSDQHRLTLRHNYVRALDDSGLSRGEQAFDFSSTQYQFRSVQNSTVLQLNSTFQDNMFNEFRAVYTRIRDQRDIGDSAFPAVEVEFSPTREINMGVGRFNQANRLDQDLFEFTNDFTYVVGDHTLTAGATAKVWSFDNLFIQDYFGQYEFNELELPSGEVISPVEAFRRGQPIEYRYSYATEAAGTDQPIATFTAFQPGVYVQDEWQVLNNLRFTAGVRVDVPIIPDEPTFNPRAYEAFGRSTANVASGNPFRSPRFGFNYNQTFVQDLSTQIRGGAGPFAGNPPYVWISNQYSNTGADFNRIDRSGLNGSNFGSGDFSADNPGCDSDDRLMPCTSGENPVAQPLPGENDLLAPVATTEINLMTDDFKYPQVFRSNFAIDQELPGQFAMTLEGLYSNTVNGVTFSNINLQQEGTSKYGRPLFGGDVSRRFTNALLLSNTDKGYSYSATVQLQRRVREGLSGSVAYTYTENKNVNSGTSSRAISNWQFNENFDVNNPRLGRSDYLVRNRVIADLTYRFSYLDRFATSIGAIYEGRSGYPFSWIYSGNANGDTRDDNDVVFVPQRETDVVLTSDNWDQMNAFIEGEAGLDTHRGSYAERNSGTQPWQNTLDLQVTQFITTVGGQKLEIIAKLENALNAVNDDWGRVRTYGFNNLTAWTLEAGEGDSGYVDEALIGTELGGRVLTQDDVGKPIVSFSEDTVNETLDGSRGNLLNIPSRWQLQLGARYTF